MDGAPELVIQFGVPSPGATRIRAAGIGPAQQIPAMQDALGALAEAISRLGGQAGIADLRGTRRCRQCGRVFRGLRADAVYCSPGCRQGAYRARLAGLDYAPPAQSRRAAAATRSAAQAVRAEVFSWGEHHPAGWLNGR